MRGVIQVTISALGIDPSQARVPVSIQSVSLHVGLRFCELLGHKPALHVLKRSGVHFTVSGKLLPPAISLDPGSRTAGIGEPK